MNVLVTGGSGFIGSNFIRYLLGRSDDLQITNLDALKYGSNPANLSDLEDDWRYSFIEGDISNYNLVSEAVVGADAVVNFAAETHVDRSISNPSSFFKSNAEGTFTLLEALRKRSPESRLVQISTDEVYGDILSGSFNEGSAIRPSSPYSASKASADVLALSYSRTYGLHTMVTRCTNNYGPYQFPEKLIPKSIIRASRSLKIPVYGKGTNIRDWLHVLDHCKAIELVLKRGERGEIYNISSGCEKTNLELLKELLNTLGRDESALEFVEDRPGHDVRYSLDSSKIRNKLGWEPEISFEEGIKSTVNWYLSNEDWWKPLGIESILHPAPWKLEW
jgi:dTDP-glucose 4,6-dehydratase